MDVQPKEKEDKVRGNEVWGSSIGYATVSSPSDLAGSETLNSWSSIPALGTSKTPRDSAAAETPIPHAMSVPSRSSRFATCKTCNLPLPTSALSQTTTQSLSASTTLTPSRQKRMLYHCRLCGDSMCPPCAQTKVVMYDADGNQKTSRVCESCALVNPRLLPAQTSRSRRDSQMPGSLAPLSHRASFANGTATSSPHTLMKYQQEKLREAEAELGRLRELESTFTDQEYIGRKAVVAEMESSDDRRRMFEEGKHHSKRCQVCLDAYKMFQREHHCRKCYRSVCGECSRAKIDSLRVCDWCISSPPPVLPACAQGQSAAMRAAEYQKMAELLWKASQTEQEHHLDDDLLSDVQSQATFLSESCVGSMR